MKLGSAIDMVQRAANKKMLGAENPQKPKADEKNPITHDIVLKEQAKEFERIQNNRSQ